MTNELTVKSEDFGITEKDAQELTKGLDTIKNERQLLVEEFNEVSTLEVTEENIKTFRVLRLKIRDNRTKGLNQWHKTNKEYFLAGGRFIDAIKNKEILVNEQMESKLMEAEKHFENLEKERIATLQKKRAEQIQEYLPDAFDVTLTDMEEDVWEAFFETKKRNHLEAIEQEKKAEAERQAQIKAEEEERERQRLENERLKAEIEEKERIAAEKDKITEKRTLELQRYIVFIRDYNKLINLPEDDYQKEFIDIKKGAEDHWEFERTEQIKKQKAESDRIDKEKAEREAYELKLKQEREQREKAESEAKAKQEALEAELQAKKDAEAKYESERIAKEQEELKKGDSEKVKDLIADIESLKTKYDFESEAVKEMYQSVNVLLDKTVSYIKSK